MTTYQRRRRQVLGLLGAGIGIGVASGSASASAQPGEYSRAPTVHAAEPSLRIAWQATYNGVGVDAHPGSAEHGQQGDILTREELDAATPGLGATAVETCFEAQFAPASEAFGCGGAGPVVDLTDAAPGDEGSVAFDLLLTGEPGLAVMRGRPCGQSTLDAESEGVAVPIDISVVPLQTDFGIARPPPGQFPLAGRGDPDGAETTAMLDAAQAAVVHTGALDADGPTETVLVEGTLGEVLTAVAAGTVRVGGDPAVEGSCMAADSVQTVRFDWSVPDSATVDADEDSPTAVALGFEAVACDAEE
ncbi:hypothetical protein [Haloarchaeobius sp. DYHT-AS-18]|uniref:hypothetical protein n=1 Tax=Haloarchaeobius sp. DYHT-AS-18 TaxID=3446117 RepID=UPI003EBBD846